MLNPYPAAAAARQPRAIVRVTSSAGNNASAASNEQVSGWASWEVTSNTYYEADTFRVVFSLSALSPSRSAAWFSEQLEVFVEVLAGFPADPANPQVSELASLIYGRVDDLSIDLGAQVLELHGRDLTAAFIDSRIAATYENQTSSQIATTLARAHGLTPVVTSTATPAGVLYKRTQVQLQPDRSEWELLTLLARAEGMVVYVTGSELHFEPDARETDVPYLVYWNAPEVAGGAPTSNAIRLSLNRALTVSKGILVTARSPSLTKKEPVVESYPARARPIQAGKASPFGQVQAYDYTLPAGKTPTEVAQFAQHTYGQIVAHEMRVEAELPGDSLLTTKTLLKVQGTDTAFDQTYYPSEIVRSMSVDQGYRMHVTAKNSSPANEVQP